MRSGAARALEVLDPPPSTPVVADWCARLGQDLFYPPNVAGWPGGRDWITTRSAIGRANFAAALVRGQDVGLSGPLDLHGLAARHGQERNPSFFARLLLGTDEPAVAMDHEAELGRASRAARLAGGPTRLKCKRVSERLLTLRVGWAVGTRVNLSRTR